MISIIYGVPGSGKTYYSVHWIKKRCLEDGDIFLRVRSDVLLITNLKLNLDASDGYIYIEDIKDFAKYMDVDFWRANFSFLQGKKVYIVMDECQLFFYHYKDDPKVLFFLQYHRHLSVDILFITQTPKSLPVKVFELAEFLVEAVPKSVNPFGWKAFRYRVLHPFDRDIVLRRFHLAFDPVVFYLYHDMVYKLEEGEGEAKNAFIRYYLLVASLVLLTVFSMFFFLSRIFSPSVPSAKAQPSHSPAVQSRVIDYEDLVREVPSSSVPFPSSFEEKPKEDSPKPSEGSYYFVITKPSQSDSPKDVLNPSPKVVIIP
jgi:zona occludens toxin